MSRRRLRVAALAGAGLAAATALVAVAHRARAADDHAGFAPGARVADDDAGFAAALAAALPADRAVDVVVIAAPHVPDAPRAWGATRVAAEPAAIKDLLLDPAHYRALIPSLIRSDLEPPSGGAPIVDWELEVPLFNLSGRMALRNRPDGVTFELVEGDFAPGRISFTVAPSATGGTTLIVDAVLDVKRSSWLLRRIIKRSPVGEPAALTAAAYVALRAVALRAEHPATRFAWRSGAAPAPPASWQPDTGALGADRLAPLRARGVVALVARTPTERLAGVAAAVTLPKSAHDLSTLAADPRAWRAFPGLGKVDVRRGANGLDADVKDDMPLVDLDATWTAQPAEPASPPARWIATAGATRGARLGWSVAPSGASSIAALTLYPRLEQTGSIPRRFIDAEPLLEQGLSLALAFADVAGLKAALATSR